MAKTIALAKVGMDSGTRASEALPDSRATETKNRLAVATTQTDTELDHFVTQDGLTFAGTHLILDLWGCTGLDDEKLIGDLVRRLLDGKHEVTAESDPHRALSMLLEGNVRFDVVLCDVMMPGLSGMDLFERVVGSRPELASRFVFITGGSYTERMARFLASAKRTLMKRK